MIAESALKQFAHEGKDDWVLFNSFEELESEVSEQKTGSFRLLILQFSHIVHTLLSGLVCLFRGNFKCIFYLIYFFANYGVTGTSNLEGLPTVDLPTGFFFFFSKFFSFSDFRNFL